MKIVVLDGYTVMQNDLTFDALKQLGEIKIYDRTEPNEIVQRLQGAEIAVVNKAVIDKNVMEKCPQLKFVAVTATGYNVVDIKEAKQRGIWVSNVPAYSTNSVVQHTFALMLELVSKVCTHSSAVKGGDWASQEDFCYCLSPLTELADKTLSIIGYGNIGKAVEGVAKSFGMKVLVHNRTPFEGSVSLEGALSKADILTLHCPLSDQNVKMINKETISLMKPSALLINTARGGLIEEKDLSDALNSGRLKGAGLDVLTQEPPSADNPLVHAKNCIITPHIAWATEEARVRLLDVTYQNIKNYIQNTPINIVNR